MSDPAKVAERLGLPDAAALALWLPLRHEDETRITPLARVRACPFVQVEGVVTRREVRRQPRPMLACELEDETGQIGLRFLNFYGSQVNQLAPGTRIRARGEARGGLFGLEMIHPRYRVVEPDTPLPQTLTPVYPVSGGLSQSMLRKAVARVLDAQVLPDTLPPWVLQTLGLPTFDEALRLLHQPPPGTDLQALSGGHHPAFQRIKFDELLAQQLSLARARALRHRQQAPALQPDPAVLSAFEAGLPFALTAAQQRVVAEIRHDLSGAHPMARLLQGDVGSGKTVVAALAAVQAMAAGFQAALMAPTEILAEQHHVKLARLLAPLGLEVVWLSGSMPARDKRAAQARLADPRPVLAIGTHALIQQSVSFARLGLSIVDEQHRFGVAQRLSLRDAAGTDRDMVPHRLMMSATPIPRTLAMTFFADLDVSVIDALPPGRTPIRTRLVAMSRRDEIIERVRDYVSDGRQAYWVCPLVEESDTLQLQTALDTHALLATRLDGLGVGLVHGRMKPADTQQVMEAFAAGQLQVLVATTVIEVGVDVPNASLMVIENAERFGLAQLHQLRGRVGRGAAASACLLLYQTPVSRTAGERLRTLYETTDGFEIARRDLQLRGPGEFLGARQSGQALLRFADLEADQQLVDQAIEIARRLEQAHPDAVEAHLQRWLAGREQFLRG